MAKKAAPKKAAPKKEPKVLKRRLYITGKGFHEVGTEVTADIEKEWEDYYKSLGFDTPVRSIDWYC